MVPMWMFGNAIACGNTFILKPSEKDPSAVDLHRRAARRGGRARGRVQRDPRRQGRRRRDPRPPGHRRGELRRVDPDRALHLRDRNAQRQAGPGPRRRQEPHDRAARRRHRHGRRCRGVGRLRLVGRTVHGGGHGRGGRRGRGPARRRDPGSTAEGQGWPGLGPRGGDGTARDDAAPRQGCLVPGFRPGAGRPGRRRRARAPALPRLRRGSSSACP